MADLVTGDTGSKLVVTCSDASNVAINLTGMTANLHWEGEDGLVISRSMDIDDAINGIVSYKFLANEIFAPKMVFEVELTDALGFIVSSQEKITLSVREQIG